MARRPTPAPKLPPPTAGQCWRVFLAWALGLPLAVAAALAVIRAALWAAGSAGLMPRAEMDLASVLFWLALIALLYPVGLVLLVLDLRDGLRAARKWRSMTAAEQAEALARQAAEAPPARKRREGPR